MTGHPSYLKRMNVLLQNVNSLAGKDNIGSEIVLKAIKILDRVGAGVKDEDIKERLHNKLESFK